METKKVLDLWGFAAYCEDEKLRTATFATGNQERGYELPSMDIRLDFSEIWVFPRHNLVFLGAGEQRGITFHDVQRVEIVGESVIGKEYGCLPLDGECYMLGKCWTSSYCRYFREAVLPRDPVLEAALTAEGLAPKTRPCPVCGGAVLADGRMRYCSPACAGVALRKQKRDYMRKKRR